MTELQILSHGTAEGSVDVTALQVSTNAHVLTWKDLGWTMAVKDRGGAKELAVLNRLNGALSEGALMAVMGPSGAGKSSLLDVLCGRKSGGKMTGEILFRGHPITSSFKDDFGYVEQNSSLLFTLTVQEMLLYSAELAFVDSRKKDTQFQTNLVNKILKQLGLEGVKDSQIGSPNARGISGGQVKRVDIAVQLLKEPKVVFMDEPTSGLDYAKARDVIKLAHDISHGQQKTSTICTIHQPSADIFELFDDVCLLHGGKTAYLGPQREIAAFFERAGAPCPAETNLADHLLVTLEEDKAPSITDFYSSSGMEEKLKASLDMELFAVASPLDSKPQAAAISPEALINAIGIWFSTVFIVFKYRLRVSMRDKGFVVPRMAMRLGLGALIGTVWANCGYDESGIHNRSMFLFFTELTFGVTTAIFVPPVINDRSIFVRERADGLYSVGTYVLIKYGMELPFLLVGTTLYSACTYWPIGMNDQGDAPIYFWLLCCTFTGCQICWAHIIASVVPSAETGVGFTVMSSISSVFFGGFMLVKDTIPVYYSWIPAINPFTYAFAGFLINEFDGQDFEVCETNDAGEEECSWKDGKFVVEKYDFQTYEKWECLRNILIIFCFYYVVLYLFTLKFVKIRR
ncbi:hypothetical protein CYMTET_37779 [Cymbomonas tetramitiformis]|uniref:ABC transporter domain-containing protein n=1 Tax=Cymbomonas tetramitiformis TaxID=36881 RepID=A0AAE0F649_9CHLO|nr:hypothetical protein CYMTET_37781 [Cymbomonas tetramitiformis]KAK3252954.1 hypothetical protein CYMTET_37779 [Cymbomonas tetramitiformis]